VPLSWTFFRSSVGALLALALLATACNGGARPTLTGEQLDESLAPTPTSLPAASAAPADTQATPEPPASQDTAADDSELPVPPAGEVEVLTIQVLATLPHDETAFTQGLELHDGVFVESTGLYGESDLRKVDPITGQVLDIVPIATEFFAEGVTRVGDEYIQLTWRENLALYWDAQSMSINRQVDYEGEGWGLCFDGTRLIMTDGSSELIFRDPATFDEIDRITVTLNDSELFNLNEIECVGRQVWANVWQSDLIVRIDPTTGLVNGTIDAAVLPRPENAAAAGAVLNGIAWDETTSSFYVTGKLWPNMYRVKFLPEPPGG